MKMSRTLLFSFLIIVLAATAGFSQRKKKSPPKTQANFLGTLTDGVYQNDFFGLTIDIPKDWYSLDQDEKEMTRELGVEMIKSKNERNNKAIDDASKREVVLLAVSQKVLGTPQNISLMIGALKQPNIRVTSQMVVEASKKLLLANPNIKLKKDIYNLKIGGKNFSAVEFQTDLGGTVIGQTLLITIRKGYSLNLAMSYFDDDGKAALESIIKTAGFKDK